MTQVHRVNQQVFNALTQAAGSNDAITKQELADIKAKMAENGIDQAEQKILNALEQGKDFKISFENKTIEFKTDNIAFPSKLPDHFPDVNEPNMGTDYFLKLADLSDDELQTWFDAHPDKSAMKRAYQQLDPPSSGADLAKLERLGTRLQGLEDKVESQKVHQQYKNQSVNQIVNGFIARAREKLAHDGTPASKERAIKDIAEDLRLLSVSGHKNAKQIEDKVYKALFKALESQDQNYYGNSATIAWHELADAVAELDGPGSGTVKAQVLKLSMQRYKESYSAAIAEKILKSDPVGVIAELEYMSDKNREDGLILDKALNQIVKRYAKDTDGAADVIGEILGKAAEQYAKVCMEDPMDMKKVGHYSHQIGYLLRAAEKSLDTLSKISKDKIDYGAFILKVFTKGVSKISGVKAIGKIGDKFIDSMKKQEYKGVDKWQKGLEGEYRRLLNDIFVSRAPQAGGSASAEAQEFKERQRIYETALQAGYQNHIDDEKSQVARQ